MFKIVSTSPLYVPKLGVLPDISSVCTHLNSTFEEQNPYSHRILLHENVWAIDIGDHIGWGTSTRDNHNEQGGILLGHVFFDEAEEQTFGVVEKAIPAVAAQGSPSYLSMHNQAWWDMLKSTDEMNDNNVENKLQVIGWYHTHPNDLSVFMSGTDRHTQRLFFSHEWQFAIVLNPHRKYWKAFYGAHANECPGFVLKQYHPTQPILPDENH